MTVDAMNGRKGRSVSARLTLWIAACGALAGSPAVSAQEPVPARDPPAPEVVPSQPAERGVLPGQTAETTAEETADRPERYRTQRERESAESATVVRQRGQDDDEPVAGGDYEENSALRDAWLDGKLEAAYALNPHLNPFTIRTRVENGMVRLTGHVESEIDRDLATEIAQNIEGVTGVRNDLVVRPDEGDTAPAEGERTFAQRIGDVTTTAAVKSRLLVEDDTRGLEINVTTQNRVVTLSGEVASEEERQLAEQIARNVDEVQHVENELRVVRTREAQ